ncbi:hypothetical protein EX895_004739 [Sporisorium graminicola]|uniref:Xylanolytic transcriptional activator regulatory domain-containing protein n=1 Tax=Sporisorium graminicola TaxID=280036 RepID=A0A4U7KQE2_9BASI|nr:hypothetical protein EX895_004739 [Sporisorium graminicola]TKY86590.1 hypothetical protein EX895_004739 [Sporisorium graminicola]
MDVHNAGSSTATASYAESNAFSALDLSELLDLSDFAFDQPPDAFATSASHSAPSPHLPPRSPATASETTTSSRSEQQLAMMRARLARGQGTFASADATSVDLGATSDCQGTTKTGTDAFFDGFAKAVPMLGPRTHYYYYLSRVLPEESPSRRMLMLAIATIGTSTRLGSESQAAADMRSRLREASRDAYAVNTLDSTGTAAESLAMTQSLLLLAYVEYGCNEITQAAANLTKASSIALQLGLNMVDQPGSASFHVLNQQDFLEHSPHGPAFFAEMCRRTWWELYLFDTMLHVSTSGKMAQTLDTEALVVDVHVPADIGCNQARPRSGQAYEIRIKAAALVRQCIKPPEHQQEPNLDRLQAIDTMLSNLIVRAQRLWANATSVLTLCRTGRPVGRFGQGASLQDNDSRWAQEMEAEVLFAAILMLHASRIQLHRQAWFNDLTLDFSSCSFRAGSPPTDEAGASQTSSLASPDALTNVKEIRHNMLSLSVARIISSSDAILRHIRSDQQRYSTLKLSELAQESPSTVTMPVHWPFFGCCNMVAAYGYVVALAAGESSEESPDFSAGHGGMSVQGVSPAADTASQTGNIPRLADPMHSLDPLVPGLGRANCNQSTSQSSSPGDRRELCPTRGNDSSVVWKARLALSNIGFAEATLIEYSQLWPICDVLRAEVSLCRAAVDFSGPTGLDVP